MCIDFCDSGKTWYKSFNLEDFPMMMNVLWMMTALVAGFMVGRISMYSMYEQMDVEETEEASVPQEERKRFRRGRGHRTEEKGQFWSVGSPASGDVTLQREGEHPTVVIHPDSDRIYAPAGGKVTRLFPMGNALLFTTDFGTELYIQAGDRNDELLVRHYRPRIVQNEVVEKGKLLLEFDRAGLVTEGASAEVLVCVENCFYGGEVRLTAGEYVKVGEEILQVCEKTAQESFSKARAVSVKTS